MNKGFKRWLCEKAGYIYFKSCSECPVLNERANNHTCYDNCYCDIDDSEDNNLYLKILIKALWKINRDYLIHKNDYCITYDVDKGHIKYNLFYDIDPSVTKKIKEYKIKNHNNSETEALKAALMYIYNEVK
jgi:hypothetical protein